MLESLERDFVASCAGEELRMLEQAAVRRSASRQGCRWRLWGIYGDPGDLVLFKEPRLLDNFAGGDERYGIRFDIDNYILLWAFLVNMLFPVNIAGLIMCIKTVDLNPTNHGSIELGTVQRFVIEIVSM